MKKITFLLFILLSHISLQSQPLYNRIWGASNDVSKWIRIATKNEKTGDFYLNYEADNYGVLYQLNANSSSQTVFFNFYPSTVKLENVIIDNNDNFIVYGRTHDPNLGTSGVYSTTPLPATIYTGHTFIAKINSRGDLIWLTYFHDLSQYTNCLTIDSSDNIYVLTKRPKTTILPGSVFQKTGDASSTKEYQDVISKIDSNGNHVWSTFYFNDSSEINIIAASNDGLYVYGVYLGSNKTHSFFSTKNSFQQNPSDSYGNNYSTVFLSKFNFNGNRLWSTYFGKERTIIPINNTSFPQALVTVGNDAYILTTNSFASQPNHMSTANTYLSTPVYYAQNNTLTMFSSNGTRVWTTYLYGGNALQTQSNELVTSGYIVDDNAYLNSMISSNAYQENHGGKTDVYTSILSNDGKNLIYSSFYGFDGDDDGIVFPVKNGLYVLGITNNNTIKKSGFSTTNQDLIGSVPGYYQGYFSAYFKYTTLSNEEFSKQKIHFNVYPNPTTNILNIVTDDTLTNAQFTVYDISGKKVLYQKTTNLNTNQINVSHLQQGVYILQIDASGISQSYKFIKK